MDFTNYTRVFEEIPFWQQMGNSFFITLSVVAGSWSRHRWRVTPSGV